MIRSTRRSRSINGAFLAILAASCRDLGPTETRPLTIPNNALLTSARAMTLDEEFTQIANQFELRGRWDHHGRAKRGSLVATCFDRAWGPVPHAIWMKCQNRINRFGAEGDSGGPVYQTDGNWFPTWRHARGLRWAASWNQGNNIGLADYSTIAGLEIDLGQLSFRTVCAGFFCLGW